MPNTPAPTVKRQVFINGRFLAQRVTGVQRYARETLRALDELLAQEVDPDEVWTLLLPPGVFRPETKFISVRTVGRLRGHLWEQLELPWHARRGLLLGLGFTGPLVKRDQIITVHDGAVIRFPGAYGWRFRLWVRFVVRFVGRRAPVVFAVSKFSAVEAAACFRISPSRIRVVTEGWQHLSRTEADDSILARLGLAQGSFALVVSSPTANKNFQLVEAALQLMGSTAPPCVAVGAAATSVFHPQTNGAALLYAGYVSDAELKSLYRHAACFVFPSIYEGFGLPALEAMSCGCPVLASTAAAIQEVCADACLYFNPAEPPRLAEHLRHVFDDRGQQTALRKRGYQNASRFSWDKSAALHLLAIRELSRPAWPSEHDAAPSG